ncbi:MAG: DUF1820 family protein [Myxococcota bacterium]
MSDETQEPIYRVVFRHHDQTCEVYARSVGPASMLGFVEVGELVFGERSKTLLDPAEERLKAEFEGVKRSYLPINAILRIDEVEKVGTVRLQDAPMAEVTPFPMLTPPPGDAT